MAIVLFMLLTSACTTIPQPMVDRAVTQDVVDQVVRSSLRGEIGVVGQHLRSGLSPDVRARSEMTPAMAAAFKGHIRILELLDEHDADFALNTPEGLSALSFAIEGDQPDAVRFLISKGIGPNSLIYRDLAPLVVAVIRNRFQPTQTLIEAGADVNFVTPDGATALMLAAERGYRDLVELLLNAGANPSLTDSNGMSAAELAESYGHTAIAKRILRAQRPD